MTNKNPQKGFQPGISESVDKCEVYTQSKEWKVLNGRNSVYSQVQEMVERADNEIRIMTTEKGIIRMCRKRFETYKDAIKNREIKVRILLPITRKNIYFVKIFMSIGAELRHIQSTPVRFVNIDKKETITHATGEDNTKIEGTSDHGIWTTADEVSCLVCTLFDKLWPHSTTFSTQKRVINKLWVLQMFIEFIVIVVAVFICSSIILSMNISEKMFAIVSGLFSGIVLLLVIYIWRRWRPGRF